MFVQSSFLQMSRVFASEHNQQFAHFRDLEANVKKLRER